MNVVPQGRPSPSERPDTASPEALTASRGGLLLLGLGNDILGDDAVGLRVVRAVRARLGDPDCPTILESCAAGLSLLDDLVGFDDAILVDAVQTGRRGAGYVHRLDSRDLPRLTIGSPHFLGVGETLALGRELGLSMPRRVTVFAVEVEDPYTLSTSLGPAVAAALPGIVEAVLEQVGRQLREARAASSALAATD